MQKPRALVPGSRVRIVSPASPTTTESMQNGLELLRAEGYEVSLGQHVLEKDGYLAGTDLQRAADINDAFADPTVDAVICSRGGYGCARLLPHLNLDQMAQSGKMFVGFSDITTLHLALNRRGLVTFHAPMLLSFSVPREPWVIQSFTSILKGQNPIPAESTKGNTINKGTVVGKLTGGCLCLLTDSLATPDPLDCEGKIVLIEDVDEHPHRIDAMLTHLLNTGNLQKAAGIVVGEMTGTDEKIDPKIGAWPWERIVGDRLGQLDVPIIINYPIGHMKTMLSTPLGVQAKLDATAGTLEILESPCA